MRIEKESTCFIMQGFGDYKAGGGGINHESE